MMKVNAYRGQVGGLHELAQKTAVQPAKPQKPGAGANSAFAKELNAAQSVNSSADVVFSKHALKRMNSRNVTLSPEQVQLLSEAIDKAGAKGARETLALTDDAAYVVAVKNRTVVSAFDKSALREGVFTNIDSAVIL